MGLFSGIVKSVFGDPGAAQQAGAVQAGTAREGIAETRRQFDITQAAAQPGIEAGNLAREQQLALLGLRGQEAQQAATAGIQESPGQQFIRQRQEKALLRNQAAIGGLGGGNVRTALQGQAAGFAQQDLQNQLSRLGGVAGQGQQAQQQIGALGAQQAGQTAQLLGQAGQAQAGGILGGQQARQQGIGNLVGIGSALLSDENMKHNIQDMTPEDCMRTVLNLDIKAWEYLPQVDLGESMHIGPMSQTAPECIKVKGKEMLDLHSELMLIAGAMQYLRNEGLIQWQ